MDGFIPAGPETERKRTGQGGEAGNHAGMQGELLSCAGKNPLSEGQNVGWGRKRLIYRLVYALLYGTTG